MEVKKLSLEELNSIYNNFRASLEATRITTKIAIEIFKDFPNSVSKIDDSLDFYIYNHFLRIYST